MVESSTTLTIWLILSCRLGNFMYWSLIPNHWTSSQAGWPCSGKSVWSDKEILRSQPSTWALHSFDFGNPWNNGSWFAHYTPLSSSAFRRGRKIRRYKCPCVYYNNSTAVFHAELVGDLVFKLNPGPISSTVRHRNNITQMHSSRNATISGPSCRQEKRNVNNLSYVKRHGSLRDVKRLLRFCVWNAQSVRNKTGILQDYLCQEKIDLCVVTESWITHDQAAVRVECTPPGYSFTGHCRSGRKGGGIAVIHRSPMLLTKITEGEKTSFEFANKSSDRAVLLQRLEGETAKYP